VPALSEQLAEDERVRQEEAELDRALEYGIGAMATGSEEQEELLAAAEWRRWEGSGRRHWDGDKRRAWAEDLLLTQLRRRRERLQRAARMAEESARASAEEAREARRRARYGTAGHHSRHHGYGRSVSRIDCVVGH
jgi:hypothetical protein